MFALFVTVRGLARRIATELAARGYEIASCAPTALREHPPHLEPSLVLISIDEKDAIKWIERAASLWPNSPIVAISAADSDAATPAHVSRLDLAIAAGASDFIFGTGDIAVLSQRVALIERRGGVGRFGARAQANMLDRVSAAAVEASTMNEAGRAMLREIAAATGYSFVRIDRIGEAPVVMSTTTDADVPEPPDEQWLLSFAEHVRERGKPMAATAETLGERDALSMGHLRTLVCVPMTSAGRIVGTLSLGHTRELSPSERRITPAVALGNHVAILTETREAEETHRSYRELLGVIHQAQERFISGAPLGTVFDGLLFAVQSLLRAELGFIGELSRDDERTMLVSHAGTPIDTVFGAVMQRQAPVYSNDAGRDPTCEHLRSYLGLPLFAGMELVGVIGLANRPDGFSPRLIEYLAPLMSTCGSLLAAHRSNVKAERTVRESEARLLLTDRMASLGTMAAGVAHEINSPLTYVSANLSVMRERLRADASVPLAQTELVQLTDEALHGAGRIAAIVRDIATFARPNSDKTEAVELATVLDASIRMVGNELAHRATVRKVITAVPPVDANASRLGQVFVNLLLNALQALPDRPRGENLIHVSTSHSGDSVSAEIRDNGVGIDEVVLARIFDPFFTTKPIGVGTGLGLSICHRIVTSLGGTIIVRSTLELGTSVTVTLPASRRVFAMSAAPPSLRTLSRVRAMIIDDEAYVGQSARRLLGAEFETTVLTDAREALDAIARGEQFDAILCDLMMPGMTGMELFAELQKVAPRLASRIGFMTGGAFTTRAQTFLEELPDRYLEKPFDSTRLRAFVRQLASQGE